MVDFVSDVNELARRVRLYAFGGSAPETVASRLQTIPGVTANLVTDAAEILYAHYDALDEAGKRLTGELFNYALQMGWTTFNRGERSAQLVENISRDLGDRSRKAPALEKWPRPDVDLRSDGRDFRIAEGETAPDPDAAPAPAHVEE